VVWDDAAGHYQAVSELVVPEGWRFEQYQGSWWDLRRRIEDAFSAAAAPKIVVYVLAAPLPADPLEEIRQAAGIFSVPLPTLLRDALAGEIGGARLTELIRRCPTLLSAEDALEGGADLDPQLAAATGARDAESALAALLVGDLTDRVIEDQATLHGLVALAQTHLGVATFSADDPLAVRATLAQHVVLGEIACVLGDDAAQALNALWKPMNPAQRRHLASLVERLGRPSSLAAWGVLADQASAGLRLDQLDWDDRLATCDVSRCIDNLAFNEAARRLVDDPAEARAIVARRIERSQWLRWRDDWSGRALADLDAIRSVARLLLATKEYPVPHAAGLGDVYAWYGDGAWEVDRAQRLMEGSRYGLARPGLDKAFTAARDAYIAWLDALLTVTNAAAAVDPDPGLPRQADIYGKHIADSGRVALVIADAMRLEIGHRLGELVRGVAHDPRVEFAVAAVPTITRVGMANLLPAAANEGLELQIDADQIVVSVDGKAIRTVSDRTDAYKAVAGRVEDHSLGDWSSLGDDVLADRVGQADLVVVRAQEIDAAGEAGLAAVRWSQIDAAVDTLAILITRLANAGITKAVVTADHGFLALGRPLDSSRSRPLPTGRGVIEHGRAWIGTPATVPEGCKVLPLADFSIRSAESLVLPDAMTVFGNAGGGFFHGGISPQEALVPVVVLHLAQPERSTAEYLTVKLSVPGGKISAEAFSIRIGLAGTLFASEVAVRITAADVSGEPVARLMPGDSVDARTGTVQLDPSEEAILTFLVTQNLDKGSAIEVTVLDAVTGRKLADARATIAKDLRPEEAW
jgi:hypothetical protein